MRDDIIEMQIERLRDSSRRRWREEYAERGVRGAWPELVAEAGDPVRALRHQARCLGGAYLGYRLDPRTGQPDTSAVLPTRLSTLVVGPPGVGKTTRYNITSATQDLAAGARVVMVTSQPKTVADLHAGATAVGDSGEVTILDLGGRIISPTSSRLLTWDPTAGCEAPEAAEAFARKLAGEDSPVMRDLGTGHGAGYWLQIPEGVTAAAAHLTAVERGERIRRGLARGLSPEQARAASLPAGGPSGISRVFEYLRRPAPPDPGRIGLEGLSRELRSTLTPPQRAALRDDPNSLAQLEQNVRHAAEHAARYPLRLQKLQYNRALLELQGAPIDGRIAGSELQELADIMESIAQRESDPLDQLGRAVRQAIPANEQRVLSPRPGDREISPEQIVRGPGGLYVVSYDSMGSPGLAAGWFCEQTLRAAFTRSAELQAEQLMGGSERFTGLIAYVDEGGGLENVDLDVALTEGRQHDIAAKISVTSIGHLKRAVGDERAQQIMQSAPITLNFAPTPDEAEEISKAFGRTMESSVTHHYEGSSAGERIDVGEREVPLVPPDRLLNLKEGEVVLKNTADPDQTVSIVRAWAFHERGHPVHDALSFAAEQPGAAMPWEELRPDVRAQLDARLAVPEPPAEGLADGPGRDDEPATVAPAGPSPERPAPVGPEPERTAVEPEPELPRPVGSQPELPRPVGSQPELPEL